jgi:site-specific DNA-methyltransferase (adenine-specific)
MNVIENLNEGGSVGQVQPNSLIHADCLEAMKYIESKSIDMILCDLPYGTTQNKWDSIIPLDILWEQYDRIIKDNGMICLTCTEPFTNQLINNKLKQYKYYDLVWDKTSTTGFLNAKRQPLRRHEQILCFYKKQTTYNPIMEVRGKPRNKGLYNKKNGDGDMCYGKFNNISSFNNEYYPTSIIQVSKAVQKGKLHPTQKPIELLENLIRTYTNKNEIVLDNTMGSGSTGVACINTKRNFIGIEKDDKYFEIACERINCTNGGFGSTGK